MDLDHIFGRMINGPSNPLFCTLGWCPPTRSLSEQVKETIGTITQGINIPVHPHAVQFNGSIAFGIISGHVGVTRDGDVFGGINADFVPNIILGGVTSAPNGNWTVAPVSASVTVTQVVGPEPSRKQLLDFVTGPSQSVTGGNIIIGGFTYSNGRVGAVVGVGWPPGINVNAGPSYSWYMGNIFGLERPKGN